MAHRGDGLNDIFEHSVIVRENLKANSGQIPTTPSNDSDIVNKKYVDDHTWTESDITDLGTYLEAGDAVMGVIVHAATAGTTRPSGFDVVTWIGSVEPTNAINNDLWIDTT